MNIKFVESIGNAYTGLKNKKYCEGWNLRCASDESMDFNVKIPCNVRSILVQEGIIEDPFIGKNNEDSQWVSEKEWIFSKKLFIKDYLINILNSYEQGGFCHLVFDAIDYDASFFINEKKIYRQIGMFSPVDLIIGISNQNYDEELLSKNEFVNLKVKFHKQPFWRQHAVKCQMSFGWDFAPMIRTIGIWKNVWLNYTGPAFFTSILAFILPEESHSAISCQLGEKIVRIRFNVKIMNPDTMKEIKEQSKIRLNIKIDNFSKEKEIYIFSNQTYKIDLKIPDIPLWNPRVISGGDQKLIPVIIKLIYKEKISDEYRGTLVNRIVKWKRNPGTWRGNYNWTININGNNLFLRGINWVPPDSLFGRISEQRYKKLIDLAKDINIDMFRVWGGGIEEKKEFYDLCDKEGIMVWQEFPFACTNYPNYENYLKIVNRECLSIVKRTAQHPSVVLYCGGNEFNPYINKHIIKIVKRAVREESSLTKCISASPFKGDDHNWRVWGARQLFNAYEVNGTNIFQMLTEFGLQAFPNINTLRECIGNDNLINTFNLASDLESKDIDSINQKLLGESIDKFKEYLSYHKADLNGFRDYAKKFGKQISTIGDFIEFSQKLQAHGLKYAIEICRSGYPNVSGVFPWQFSDPWPNISWSVVDYYFRPKLAYKMLKIAYSPILPMVRNWKVENKRDGILKGDLIVHSMLNKNFIGSLKVIEEYNFTNKAKSINRSLNEKIKFKIKPFGILKIGTIKFHAKQGNILRLVISDDLKQKISENFEFPSMMLSYSIFQKAKDFIDARFDGWWRKYMIKLMELERRREEYKIWLDMKKRYLS
ncbi:MAG: glycosyl hydrolase 2 galactose-binding domain-containing protein [Promethearchaeota archaeon]